MPSVNFYFQVHQPYRLANHSYFSNSPIFDENKNKEIMLKVARKCYLPTNQVILDLIEKYQGKFKVSYSISGVAIEQMQEYSPETLESFIRLSKTGCVEFISETYYHSLAAVYDEQEFREQVLKHRALIEELFSQTPKVFRNTELIYNDHIGWLAADMGYKAVIAEGPDDILGWRSPNFVYQVNGSNDYNKPTKLLLKNYKLSDDIAFRFSNQGWDEFPLTADKFAKWAHNINGAGEVLNLFMDYETFGEHQWEHTGIFEFLKYLPEAILRHPDWDFVTVSEAAERYQPFAQMKFERLTSWADADRDLTAWRGNKMQVSALNKIYEIGSKVKESNDKELLDTWRKLLTSDHFYYMCTKWFADGDVHAYFSPYGSPYDAFINFMNGLRQFEARLSSLANSSERKVVGV